MFLAQNFSKSKNRENILMLKIGQLKTTTDYGKSNLYSFFFFSYPISFVLATSSDTSKFNFCLKRHRLILIFPFLAIEISTIYDCIVRFMSNASPEKCLKQIWPLKEKLSIPNILQFVEICIVLPLSNAEVERVFSTFSKMMTREVNRFCKHEKI